MIGAKRTPFCKYGGSLRELPASHVFAAAAKDAINSGNLNPSSIDSTVVANVNFVSIYILQYVYFSFRWLFFFFIFQLSQCDGGKTSRYCGTYSGVPIEKPALGVNKACGSGLQAIITGAVVYYNIFFCYFVSLMVTQITLSYGNMCLCTFAVPISVYQE